MTQKFTYKTPILRPQKKPKNTAILGSLFTGKEKDSETGYYYFGARYYNSDLSLWLSVDPMADKYPSLSPYNYCAWNPMKLVDPDGENYELIVDHKKRSIVIKAYYMVSENNSDAYNSASQAISFWNNLSGKYSYVVNDGNSNVNYSISFDLQVATPNNIPSDLNENNYNRYSLVDSFEDNNVNGTTYINSINILDSQKDSQTTGPHEIGHSLGLSHTYDGLMEEDGGRLSGNKGVTNNNVYSIIKNAQFNGTSKSTDGRGIGTLQESGSRPKNFNNDIKTTVIKHINIEQ